MKKFFSNLEDLKDILMGVGGSKRKSIHYLCEKDENVRASGSTEYKHTIACTYTEYRWKDSQGTTYTHSFLGVMDGAGCLWDKNGKELSPCTFL